VGHQVNFFITPDDARMIETELKAEHPLVIIDDISTSAAPSVVDTAAVEDRTGPRLFFHMVRGPDLRSVVMKHVPARGEWAVDVLDSPAIEYTRSFFDGRVLRRGRLYYVDRHDGEDGTLIDKSAVFREWARLVLEKTRKLLKRQGTDYIGPHAKAWLESSGGKLVA
jgi:hypothetical protein